MSKIRDKLRVELRDNIGLKEWQIDGIFTLRKLAIVDREAKPPQCIPEAGNISEAQFAKGYRKCRRDMLLAGWFKEVKE